MAEIINMPRLSDTMEEGTVATWFKKVGDTVKEGDILAEIETDKATMEFEAFHEGELCHWNRRRTKLLQLMLYWLSLVKRRRHFSFTGGGAVAEATSGECSC